MPGTERELMIKMMIWKISWIIKLKDFMKSDNKNNDLLSKIVINKMDFLTSICTIQKSINKLERQKLNKS
jgi:hypothetical protein